MTRPAVLAIALTLVTVIRVEPHEQATATVSGRVLADATGEPIPNVRVTIPNDTLGAPVVLSDAEGRFSLPAPAGPFRVVASKSGFGRVEIPLTTATQSMTVRLRRGAAISGRIVDDFGEPVLAARVLAQAPSTAGGSPAVAATTDTDDRGEYRLPSLAAGSYVVRVETMGALHDRQLMPNGTFMDRGPTRHVTFYPNATAPADAHEFRLQAGDDQSDVDFVIPVTQSGNQPFSVIRAAPSGPIIPRPADPKPAGAPGIVRGRVSDADGRALPNAQVLLLLRRPFPSESRFARTDPDGRFEFLDVTPGNAQVTASKPGYFPVESTNIGVSFTLGAGETRTGVDVTLARWGTLTGHVVDEYGDPVQGAGVQLMQVRYESGRRRLVPTNALSRLTDDRGIYRLYGIAPGQYIVSAAVGDVSSADLPGYVRSYFPGTAIPGQAQFIPIGRGLDAVGVDVVLSRMRTARVAGRMLNAAGEQTTGGMLNLLPSWRASSVTNVPLGARIKPDGTFEFPNVIPGQYVIQAYRGRLGSSTEGEFGALAVAVADRDVTDLVVRMSAGSSITGRFSFDSSDPGKRPASSTVEFSALPVDFDASPASVAVADVRNDWTFRMAGINGPRRLQLVRTPPGWALKEIRVNGIDVSDRPIAFGAANQSLTEVEVVLTDRISELAGTIGDDGGRTVPGASVIVFSTARDQWYPASRFLGITTAGDSGAFTIAGLPSGSYYAAAVAQPPTDGDAAWQDPAFLTTLIPRASTVTIAAGERRTLALRLIR